MKELDEAFAMLHRDARAAPAGLADARQRLMDEIDGVRPRRARRRWAIPVAAAAGAIALAAAVVVVRTAPSPGEELPLASAPEVLNKAADITDVGAVDKPIEPGQYRYVAERRWITYGVPDGTKKKTIYPYLQEELIERWIPAVPNGIRQIRRTSIGEPKNLADMPADAGARIAASRVPDETRTGRCKNIGAPAGPGGIECDTLDRFDFYAALPRDPVQLNKQLDALATQYGPQKPSMMFKAGIDALTRGLMTAQLRAQWYRALALIPGVRVIERRTTVDGRSGVALGLDDQRERQELVIDMVTGEFIGTRTLAGPQPSNPAIEPGTEIGASTITTSVVSTLGATS
ncbi:CU044_5270 family protein [Kibdelosporangium phytohabitans]|uniref:CU044_5270 family protein n=1 Tax=Kibdelosporangium phytohabitans TaxID=860235 RepID=A0A0N9HZ48_9PSEU|nr:CU044_5270 family protein [Kibdelosporangium phytohabitans]ALG08654.1 hypothetical protein AOZ06_18570 [Kibdelosporangium phytohabitans]MBE1470245.1 hypothetical protein [Kibdelosporangium phytohabitans]